MSRSTKSFHLKNESRIERTSRNIGDRKGKQPTGMAAEASTEELIWSRYLENVTKREYGTYFCYPLIQFFLWEIHTGNIAQPSPWWKIRYRWCVVVCSMLGHLRSRAKIQLALVYKSRPEMWYWKPKEQANPNKSGSRVLQQPRATDIQEEIPFLQSLRTRFSG